MSVSGANEALAAAKEKQDEATANLMELNAITGDLGRKIGLLLMALRESELPTPQACAAHASDMSYHRQRAESACGFSHRNLHVAAGNEPVGKTLEGLISKSGTLYEEIGARALPAKILKRLEVNMTEIVEHFQGLMTSLEAAHDRTDDIQTYTEAFLGRSAAISEGITEYQRRDQD